MKRVLAALLALALCGCINVNYRPSSCPNNGAYFCTVGAAFFACAPFSDSFGDDYAETAAEEAALTALLPLLFVDVLLEAVADTLFLPWDLYKGVER